MVVFIHKVLSVIRIIWITKPLSRYSALISVRFGTERIAFIFSPVQYFRHMYVHMFVCTHAHIHMYIHSSLLEQLVGDIFVLAFRMQYAVH